MKNSKNNKKNQTQRKQHANACQQNFVGKGKNH